MISKIKNFLFSNVDDTSYPPNRFDFKPTVEHCAFKGKCCISYYDFVIDENNVKPTDKYNCILWHLRRPVLNIDGIVMSKSYQVFIKINGVSGLVSFEQAGGIIDAFIEKNLNIKTMNGALPYIAPYLVLYAHHKIQESQNKESSFMNLIYSDAKKLSYSDFFDTHFSYEAPYTGPHVFGEVRDACTALENILDFNFSKYNIDIGSYFSKTYNSLVRMHQ